MTSARERADNDAVARWGNLPLEERVADRLAAILFAAAETGDMIALAEHPAGLEPFRVAVEEIGRSLRGLIAQLSTSITDAAFRNVVNAAERDPELEQVLLKLDGDLRRSSAFTKGAERDAWWEQVEHEASPYALAFYYEIRRLDDLRLWGTLR
ncbi:MAG: hypothetical protein ABI779_08290 [Acidobacteriota bacterium]